MYPNSSLAQAAAAQRAPRPESKAALRQWIERHPILAYLILAYAVSWTIFLVPLLSREGLGIVPFDAPPYELFILLVSVLGLTGSAFTITALVDGRPGVRALASRYVRWRVGVQWYLIAFFGLLVVALVGITVVFGFAPIGALPHQGPALIGYLVQVVLVAALVNLWEETGWTGFMFTRLQPRYGALVASLLVAPCFGGIHLPLLFVKDAITNGRLSPSLYPIALAELLVLFSVPVRVLAAWVYNNARGSLLIIGLLHSSLDAVTGAVILPYLLPKGVDPGIVVYGSFGVAALLLIIVTRGRLSYKQTRDLQPVPSAE
ncbi:MAG TPA: CPBP family glutamic-type intramembrane protease [Ktedonobacterales bacterium]